MVGSYSPLPIASSFILVILFIFAYLPDVDAG